MTKPWSIAYLPFQLIVANLLKQRETFSTDTGFPSQPLQCTMTGDPLWDRGQMDLRHMAEILNERAEIGDNVAKTRAEILSKYI
jgi:hypothetical protein